jgi:hypothetical protein
MAAIIIYFVTAEVIASQVEDFRPGGFVDFGSATIWAIRCAFIVTGLIGLAIANTLFSDERFAATTLNKAAEVTDSTLFAALQSAHIVRLAFTESIAIYGLNLFMMNGHRYDLYGFGFVALIVLIIGRPSRIRWEAIFRRVSIEHAGVSSSPWPTGTV